MLKILQILHFHSCSFMGFGSAKPVQGKRTRSKVMAAVAAALMPTTIEMMLLLLLMLLRQGSFCHIYNVW